MVRALELVRGAFEDRTWQMFWLTVVEDQTPADVAVRFGVTPVAVRKAKSRVLHRLRHRDRRPDPLRGRGTTVEPFDVPRLSQQS